jgi:hypothetical protein
MFGRRRHVAPVVAPPAPAPQLTENQVFDIIHAEVARAIGENGEWTLTRRVEHDSDSLFHGVVAHALATHVLDALRDARTELERRNLTAAAHSPEHVAHEPVALEADADEPAAFSWEPAPITVWTDLKKPVTGPIAQIREHQLVA